MAAHGRQQRTASNWQALGWTLGGIAFATNGCLAACTNADNSAPEPAVVSNDTANSATGTPTSSGNGDTSHDHRDVLAQPATVADVHDVQRLAVGHEHACVIQSDHTLWCWGRNAEGQVGSGAEDTVCDSGDASPNQSKPIRIELCAEGL